MPVTAVAALIQHNTSGLISLKEKGIDTPKNMEGYTYATWDLETEKAIVKYVMEQDGGDFSKLELIPSTVADVVSALQTNVDLVWIYYAWDGVAAKLQGLETNYINFADLDTALDYYSPVIIGNDASTNLRTKERTYRAIDSDCLRDSPYPGTVLHGHNQGIAG